MIEGEAPDDTWPLLAAGEGATAPTEEVVAQGLEAAKEPSPRSSSSRRSSWPRSA